MIQEVNSGADESEHRNGARDESGSVQQPAEQEGIEGRDAGPEHEGHLVEGDERVPTATRDAGSAPAAAVSRRVAIERTLTMPMKRMAASNIRELTKPIARPSCWRLTTE